MVKKLQFCPSLLREEVFLKKKNETMQCVKLFVVYSHNFISRNKKETDEERRRKRLFSICFFCSGKMIILLNS